MPGWAAAKRCCLGGADVGRAAAAFLVSPASGALPSPAFCGFADIAVAEGLSLPSFILADVDAASPFSWYLDVLGVEWLSDLLLEKEKRLALASWGGEIRSKAVAGTASARPIKPRVDFLERNMEPHRDAEQDRRKSCVTQCQLLVNEALPTVAIQVRGIATLLSAYDRRSSVRPGRR